MVDLSGPAEHLNQRRSKNLLNTGTKDFSFFDWDNGFGFAAPEQTISFDNVGKHIINKKNDSPQKTNEALATFGKAYMQRVRVSIR